jgi:lipoprotein-anchoring transpeptidase ErfK/SrfK
LIPIVRARFIIIPGVLVASLLALGGAVYAYDSGQKTRLADGITVGGVDVGGMETGRAETKLHDAVLTPLKWPIEIRYRGQRFKLTPKEARISVDLQQSLDRAVAASRDGNMVSRTWRELTGTRVSHDVGVDVDYSREAVRSLVDRVSAEIDRPAVDASLDLESGQVDPRPSKVGLAVRAAQLRRDIRRELVDVDDRRTVRVRTRTVQPKVTREQLVEKYPAIIVIKRNAFELTLYKDLKRAKTYGIGVGRSGTETPAGLYDIQNKAVNPSWAVPDREWAGDLAGQVIPSDDPRNPIEARWMGIYDGAGIHGTDDVGSIGNAESHGCIRMRISEVKSLYDEVPVGAPVYIG